MLPETSQNMDMPFAQKGKKKNERHFGVYALLNLKSDVSFVMFLRDGEVETIVDYGEIVESTVHVKRPLILQEGGGEGLGKLDPAWMFLASDGHSRNSICAGFSDL